MNYKEIEKAVSQKEMSRIESGEELLHFLALTGLLKLFSDGVIEKDAATEIKALLREDYENPPESKKERLPVEIETEVQEIQNKIQKAVLLNANPWSILLQACKAISLLTEDENMFFWQNVKEDCYVVCGQALGDVTVIELSREDLEKQMSRLIELISEERDIRRKHILVNAKIQHEYELNRMKEMEDNKCSN